MSGELKILVTGASGFIGHHLCRYLRSKGFNVKTLDIKMPPDAEVDGWPSYSVPITALPSLTEELEKEDFACVVHLAAQTSVQGSVMDPQQDATTNILGTIAVLEFCSALEIPMVYAASGGTCFGYHGDQGTLMRVPIVTDASPYALSKQVGEAYCELYHRLRGLQYVSLRLANVYGLGEHGVISKWLKAFLRGDKVVVTGDGTQRRDFIYIADVVRAFEVVITKLVTLPPGELCRDIANIGWCKTIPLNSVLVVASGVTCENIAGRVTFQERPPGEVYNAQMLPTRWMEEQGWEPMVTLEQGIQRLWDLINAEETEKQEGSD